MGGKVKSGKKPFDVLLHVRRVRSIRDSIRSQMDSLKPPSTAMLWRELRLVIDLMESLESQLTSRRPPI